jgi:hypothetical protein
MVDLENHSSRSTMGPTAPILLRQFLTMRMVHPHLLIFIYLKYWYPPRKGVVNIVVILQACRRRKVADNPYSETCNTWRYFTPNEPGFPKQHCVLRVPRICLFTGVIAEFWKRLLASSRLSTVCPYVLPHGTTWLPLDEFLWNLVFEYFSKICSKIQVTLTSEKNNITLH